jgi:rfaE bifunctional protein nucleotidyltransferase chain/domain
VYCRPDEPAQIKIRGILDIGSYIAPAQRLSYRREARQFVSDAQQRGRRVVIVTGCFDLLTVGHIQFLKRAKENGDVLVVGLENDTRVRAFKGPLRPVNTVSQRLEVMDALECVDHAFVIAGSPKTPLKEFYTRLHRTIRADVLAVTEGDPHVQDRREEIEAAGGKLVVIPRFDANSTTSLLRQFLATIEYSDAVLVSKRHVRDFARERGHDWRQLKLPLPVCNEAE